MKIALPTCWKDKIEEKLKTAEVNQLMDVVANRYSDVTCYPEWNKIYSAFDICRFNDVKVVIIGQDPYHGIGQANGLCFSVSDGVRFPPSLINIFKELEADVGEPIPISGNLERWASQGVLLLNSILTVEESKPGSHKGIGWEQFTDTVIEIISCKLENVVFLLWGSFAHKKGRNINTDKHLVLKSGHPSPLSANRGYWFGNKHFSKVNSYLEQCGKTKIEW